MIAIVGGIGANIASVVNACDRQNKKAIITTDHVEINRASHVIVPGVGTAKEAMSRLDNLCLPGLIKKLTQPVLGICLGMQVMGRRSDEGGDVDGLGIVEGCVRLLTQEQGLPLPHMGWNNLVDVDLRCPLFTGLTEEDYFYFVHSYVVDPGSYSVAFAEYGQKFTAAIQRDNFFGVQFHPEKSGKSGTKLLRNFLNL